jgi:diphosphomevalonate decarboxylase
MAFPIQGILKYHGMSDWGHRIAYLPSISLNNAGAQTKSYVVFDSKLREDVVVINENIARGRDLERAEQSLDTLRGLTNTKTRALVVSKNYAPEGKGLGTSAAGSAALALACVDALLGKEYSENKRFLSVISRYIAGSGCRSSTGGISLWLSYPGVESANSFSIRLDYHNFQNVDLITVPIESRIGLKTEDAHKDAPNSEFFKKWMEMRKNHVIELIDKVKISDWESIAQLAELDTIYLHGVTMSGQNGRKRKIISWEPETIGCMRMVNNLREKDIPVYYSIDTGPTPVFITDEKFTGRVCEEIEGLNLDFIKSKIGGKSEVLDADGLRDELFTERVKRLVR